MQSDFSTGFSGPPFNVTRDPNISAQHSANVESSIGDALYDADDEYQQVDPIVGSSPSGRMPHSEMLGDD